MIRAIYIIKLQFLSLCVLVCRLYLSLNDLRGEVTRQDIHNSELPEVCRACEARHRGVCGALTSDQLTRLNRHTRRENLNAYRNLPEADGANGRYANILRGVVKLTKLMEDGRQQIVGLQFAPDFVGRPFHNDSGTFAEAATETSICSFPSKVLAEMIAEAPNLERRLHAQTLKELDEAREWMLTLGRKTAVEKVASFLLLLAKNFDPEALDRQEIITFELPLTRSDIGDFLGLTVETVSRQMTNLRRKRLIELEKNRRVTVIDLTGLEIAASMTESDNWHRKINELSRT